MNGVTCVTIDCDDPVRVADFWAALGWTRKGCRVVPPTGGIFLATQLWEEIFPKGWAYRDAVLAAPAAAAAAAA